MTDTPRDIMERAAAIHFGNNRQPDMSGNPLNRLVKLDRRRLSKAVTNQLEALKDAGFAIVPVEATYEIVEEFIWMCRDDMTAQEFHNGFKDSWPDAVKAAQEGK